MNPGSTTTGSGRISVMINSSVMRNGTNLTLVSRGGDTYTYWKRSYYKDQQ